MTSIKNLPLPTRTMTEAEAEREWQRRMAMYKEIMDGCKAMLAPDKTDAEREEWIRALDARALDELAWAEALAPFWPEEWR